MTQGGDYRPQLDSLRGIAVLGVLYTHLWDPGSMAGSVGVRIFFVLSGYLITTILIDQRAGDGARSAPRHAWRNFFIRRALRLWPAYYLLLAAAAIVDLDEMRGVVGWHALYLSNFLFAIHDDYLPWPAAPFWTLSVEEQFYLLWPALMLIPVARMLPWCAIAMIAIGTGWHILFELRGDGSLAASLLLPASLDALGGGGLLALAMRARGGAVPSLLVPVALLTLPVLAGLVMMGSFGSATQGLSVLPMAAAVALAVRGMTGPLGRLLDLWVLRAIGRISYGIYLYHYFVLAAVYKLSLMYGELPGVPTLHAPGPVTFLIAGGLTILVALGSWHLIEAPANRLKRYFPYPRPASMQLPEGREAAGQTRPQML